MKRLCLMVSIFLLMTIMATSQVFASRSGLLIGLRRESPEKRVGISSKYELGPSFLYRTLWIFPTKTSYKAKELKNIILPGDKGFREVGVVTPVKNEWSEDQVYAVPFGKKPVTKITVDPENTSGNICICILFAGSKYIGISGQTGGYTKGAAHPWAGNFLNMLSIDNIKKKMEIQDVLGSFALTALKKSAAEYRQNHPDEKEKLYEEVDSTSWALIRRNGAWVARGFLDYSYEVFRGHYAHFDIPVKLPAQLVSHDELMIPWSSIKRQIPDAVDACSSPEDDMLAVITPNKLYIFEKEGKIDLKKPSYKTSLWNESPVMIQWATDSFVDKWTQDIRKMGGKEI